MNLLPLPLVIRPSQPNQRQWIYINPLHLILIEEREPVHFTKDGHSVQHGDKIFQTVERCLIVMQGEENSAIIAFSAEDLHNRINAFVNENKNL